MNDVLGGNSECSSGCESGWTLYLEHSFLSPFPSNGERNLNLIGEKGVFNEEKRSKFEDEEEDLSMVSDASSGPPHLHEDDGDSGCFYNAPIDTTTTTTLVKKQRLKENRRKNVQEQPSLLDDTDTASSPIFNFSNNNFTLGNNQASMENALDFSQGYSATHFEGRSGFNGNFGFYQSSLSGNPLQQNQWFEGKRWG